MGDWGQTLQGFTHARIDTASIESIGVEVAGAIGLLTTSTTWPLGNQAYYIPFVVPYQIVVAKMFVMNGAAVSGNLDLGLYDEEGNRLNHTGSTAQAGTSVLQLVTLAQTLNPGCYYMALSVDNTTATVTGQTKTAVPDGSGFGILTQNLGAVALPATATWVTAATAFIPYFGLTTRTVV